jgi:transglutaminase-like putative cysteine protease
MVNMLKVLVLLLIFLVPFQALASSHAGRIVMTFDLSAHNPGETARLWIPYPISDERQLVNNVSVKGTFGTAAVYTDRKHATPMLFAQWSKDAKERKLILSFKVDRKEVLDKKLPDKEPCWAKQDYARYLEPTSLAPLKGPVKALADKITKGKKSVKAKAKAVYDWVVENTYRDPKTRGCGPGDVCALLDKPGGKCADIHSVFIALARAAGVPSREIFGIRQGKKDEQDITTWQHCWAEFFLPGYGWVPVDPADVRKKMLTEGLKLGTPETKKYRQYFWGGIDAYRVKLSTGRDLTLNPRQAGKPVNYLMYPFAQVGGTTLDWLDPKTFNYTIRWYSK